MSQGISLLVYPVKDLAQAKAVFTAYLGVEPYADSAWYVGYRVGDQEIGLDPNATGAGPLGYVTVTDVEASLQALVAAGAEVVQEPKDVGGGKIIGKARDADGNILGFAQA